MGYLHFYSQIRVQYHEGYLKDQHVILYIHLSGEKQIGIEAPGNLS